MRAVRYSSSAQSDLLEAWLYIAENSVVAADQLLDKIETQTRTLAMRPDMGRKRDELAEGLRSWPTSTPYIVFYFAGESGITIARILHHARDVPAVPWWPKQ